MSDCTRCGGDPGLITRTHGCTDGSCPHQEPLPWVPRAVLDECRAQRDRARDIAALLESELADLRAKVDAVRALAGEMADRPGWDGEVSRDVFAALGDVAGQDDRETT